MDSRIEQCKLIDLPIINDPRGNLTFIECDRHIPFEIKRVYYLYDVPGGASRAGHGHKELHQLVIAMSGSFDIADNPKNILRVSDKPALDLGIAGAFDENGVVPCAVVKRGDEIWLYYAGYQLGLQVKFYAYSGLAVSKNNGETFERYQQFPICDRRDGELFFRVIHSIMFDNNVWRVWYGGGQQYDLEAGKQLPRYNIRYTESADGIKLDEDFTIAVDTEGDDEHRVGRPYVIKCGGKYLMFYAAGRKSRGFRLAFAQSDDGKNWVRKDNEIGIDVSESGFDSEMMSYPSVVTTKAKTFLFYNGNNYGRDGFGYAILKEW
jgi:hypothetical protein